MNTTTKETTMIMLSWELIDTACNDLIDQMLSKAVIPKRIVGLTRGGLVPAVILSHKLNVPMSAVDWQTRDGSVRERLKLEALIEDLEEEDKLLIVDDIADSGRTFAEILQSLPDELRKQVLLAAVVFKSSSSVTPHFSSTYHACLPGQDDVWFVFPYESSYTNLRDID